MSHWCGSQRRSWNATLIKLVMLVVTASDVLQPKWHISFAHQQSIAEVLANSAAAARVISGDTLTDAVKTDWKDLNLHISRPAIGLPTISISISYYDHNYTYKQTNCATSIFRIFTHQRFSLQQILLTFFIYTFKYPQLSAGQTGLSENRSAKKPTPRRAQALHHGAPPNAPRSFFASSEPSENAAAWYFCSLIEIWRKHINVTYLYLEHLEIFLFYIFCFFCNVYHLGGDTVGMSMLFYDFYGATQGNTEHATFPLVPTQRACSVDSDTLRL